MRIQDQDFSIPDPGSKSTGSGSATLPFFTLLDEQGEYADHVVSCEEGEEESEEEDAESASEARRDVGMPRQPVPPATLPLRAYLGQPMQAAMAALYKRAGWSLQYHRMPLRERKR